MKWRFQTVIFVTFYFITSEKVNWFDRFHSEDFDLKDVPRSGCPTEVDDDKIKAMIENNRGSTTREIAQKLNISHTTVSPGDIVQKTAFRDVFLEQAEKLSFGVKK